MCKQTPRTISPLPTLAIAAVTGTAVLVVTYASTILTTAAIIIGFAAGFSITLLAYKLWVTGGLWLTQRPATAEQAETRLALPRHAPAAAEGSQAVSEPRAIAPRHVLDGTGLVIEGENAAWKR